MSLILYLAGLLAALILVNVLLLRQIAREKRDDAKMRPPRPPADTRNARPKSGTDRRGLG
jgi:hypothetical protein